MVVDKRVYNTLQLCGGRCRNGSGQGRWRLAVLSLGGERLVLDREKLASPGVISQEKATGELLRVEGTLTLCPAWAAACYKGHIAV